MKTRVWLGNPTSCLIFGASLVGARKHYLARPLVDYRIHGDNLFHGRSVDENGDFRRSLAISRLFGYLVKRQHYLLEELDDFIHREFCTCPDPTWLECRRLPQAGLSLETPSVPPLGHGGEDSQTLFDYPFEFYTASRVDPDQGGGLLVKGAAMVYVPDLKE